MKTQLTRYSTVATLLLSAHSAFAFNTTWKNIDSAALVNIAGAVSERKALIGKISTHDNVISKIDNRLKIVDGQTSIDSTEAYSGTTLAEKLDANIQATVIAQEAANNANQAADSANTLATQIDAKATAAAASAAAAESKAEIAYEEATKIIVGDTPFWSKSIVSSGIHDLHVANLTVRKKGVARFCYTTNDVDHKSHDSQVWLYRDGQQVVYRHAYDNHSGCYDIPVSVGQNLIIREWGWRTNWSTYWFKSSDGRSIF